MSKKKTTEPLSLSQFLEAHRAVIRHLRDAQDAAKNQGEVKWQEFHKAESQAKKHVAALERRLSPAKLDLVKYKWHELEKQFLNGEKRAEEIDDEMMINTEEVGPPITLREFTIARAINNASLSPV